MAEENPNNAIVRDGDTEFSGAEYWSAVGNLAQPDAAQKRRELAADILAAMTKSYDACDCPEGAALSCVHMLTAIDRVLAEREGV